MLPVTRKAYHSFVATMCSLYGEGNVEDSAKAFGTGTPTVVLYVNTHPAAAMHIDTEIGVSKYTMNFYDTSYVIDSDFVTLTPEHAAPTFNRLSVFSSEYFDELLNQALRNNHNIKEEWLPDPAGYAVLSCNGNVIGIYTSLEGERRCVAGANMLLLAKMEPFRD